MHNILTQFIESMWLALDNHSIIKELIADVYVLKSVPRQLMAKCVAGRVTMQVRVTSRLATPDRVFLGVAPSPWIVSCLVTRRY